MSSHPISTDTLPVSPATQPDCAARRWHVGGRVQGVGFRPFVYRLAHRLGLSGWVRNELGEVSIVTEGPLQQVQAFGVALLAEAPPLARPELIASAAVAPQRLAGFRILASREDAQAHIHLPPDYYTCEDCLAELHDPADRRYRYPFINCTQCGPRYTIIDRLPYDRPATSMARFELCPACRAEYLDPLDRRFHAEPVACPQCGPSLTLQLPGAAPIADTAQALDGCVTALRAGRVLAVKGVGGYHLLCDATNGDAIAHLRATKPRPHKPLAVMVPARGADGLDAARAIAVLQADTAALLRDPARPIVLVPLRPEAALSPAVAPGLREVGLMLPYSPLHHLLLDACGSALVATSANLSGEPVLTEAEEVERRLAHVAQGFLHHNRPIRRPADDAVLRPIAGAARPLRLGRGGAPLEIALPFALREPLLALGGHLKNNITLAWERRAVISPHIGDLGSPRSLEVFEQVIADLQALYQVPARRVACDAHPDYASTRRAEACGLPVTRVFHHHAHAAALAFEAGLLHEPMLVFTWDGTGYGADATIWGGEGLLGRPGAWRRVAAMRAFRLPGGERAGREPWRSALALCWEAAIEWPEAGDDYRLLHQAWQRGLNSPISSAVGRLFDAAAALTGLVRVASFEGHGPMWLEAACTGKGPLVDLPLAYDAQSVLRCDWSALLPMLLDGNLSPGQRAAGFHASLAHTLVRQSETLRDTHGVRHVGLTGGVFQNRVLSETAVRLLERSGFEVHLAQRIPANDAGISFGQVVEAALAPGAALSGPPATA